eukprot:scaffold23068_cov27-Tisochrysis_lutea.AAC.2
MSEAAPMPGKTVAGKGTYPRAERHRKRKCSQIEEVRRTISRGPTAPWWGLSPTRCLSTGLRMHAENDGLNDVLGLRVSAITPDQTGNKVSGARPHIISSRQCFTFGGEQAAHNGAQQHANGSHGRCRIANPIADTSVGLSRCALSCPPLMFAPAGEVRLETVSAV